MPLEKDLQSKILRFVQSKDGGMGFKIHKASVVGVPDLFLFAPEFGYTFVEVKNGKKGVLSKVQKKMIELMKKAGVNVEVITTWEEWINYYKSML